MADCTDCNGACCKRVDLKTHEIIRCQYLTDEDLCGIYEIRPIACRLDDTFTPEEVGLIHCAVAKRSVEERIPW